MKVLLLFQSSPIVEGRAVSFRRISAMLPLIPTDDVEICVYTLISSGDLHEKIAAFGYNSGTLGANRIAYLPVAAVRLARAVRRERVDLLQAHEALSAVAAGLACRLLRKRPALVYWRHHAHGGRKLRWASRLAARLADVTYVESIAVGSRAQQDDGTSPEDVKVVHCGVSDVREVTDEEVRTLRSQLGIPEGAPVVGAVSRLRHEKGLDVLIGAVEILGTRSEATPHLVIAGEGPERAPLERLASGCSDCVVHLVGHQDDISLWYALSDVVAMPSRREGFGRSAIEAAAAGRAVLASDVDGLAEAVRAGVTGVLVPVDDPVAWADALERAFDDPEAMHAMGRAGRELFLSHFTLEHMVERWRQAWRGALTARGVSDTPSR